MLKLFCATLPQGIIKSYLLEALHPSAKFRCLEARQLTEYKDHRLGKIVKVGSVFARFKGDFPVTFNRAYTFGDSEYPGERFFKESAIDFSSVISEGTYKELAEN